MQCMRVGGQVPLLHMSAQFTVLCSSECIEQTVRKPNNGGDTTQAVIISCQRVSTSTSLQQPAPCTDNDTSPEL